MDIACPESCPFLPRATHEAFLRVRSRLADVADSRPAWRGEAARALLWTDAAFDEWERLLVDGWIQYGYRGPDGDRLVDVFVREWGDRLGADERVAIERLREAWFSLFEVVEVRRGQGLDLVSGRTIFLQEAKATYYQDPGNLLLGWLVELAEGYRLAGGLAVLPPALRDDLVSMFAEERSRLRAASALRGDALTVSALPAIQQRLRQREREARARRAMAPGAGPAGDLRKAARSFGAAVADMEPATDDFSGGEGEPASPDGVPPPSAAGPAHELPPLAHEVMVREVPALAEVIPVVVRHMHADPAWSPTRTLTPPELTAVPGVQRFLEDYAVLLREVRGWSRRTCAEEANFLGHHLHYMAHYEAHYRKTFWVDESLAWMLRHTQLDVVGSFLRPPFACCAFVFTDRGTLELAESILGRERDCSIRGRRLRILTAYVTQLAGPGDAVGYDVCLLSDAGTPYWPYLIARSLLVWPDAHLEEILDSHFPEVAVDELDPLFGRPELKQLIHLVLNCVLYATTAHLDATILPPPGPRAQPSHMRPGKPYSNEDVFYLPGRIPISRIRQMRDMAANTEGRRFFARFMVRGHWRRPAPNWKEQALRWIEPYWKGPDLAMIIEREYRMKP